MIAALYLLSTVWSPQAATQPDRAGGFERKDMRDVRGLSAPITVRQVSGTVGRALASISAAAGAQIRADADISDEPLILFTKRRAANVVLDQVARLFRWEWRRETTAHGAGFVLVRPREAAEREADEQRRWKQKRQTLRDGRSAVISSMLDRCSDYASMSPDERADAEASDPYLAWAAANQGSGFMQLASSLTSDERQALAGLAQRPIGPVSATDDRAMLTHLVQGAPIESLSAGTQQDAVRFWRDHAGKGDIAGGEVGLVAYGGSTGLAVRSGDRVAVGWNMRAPDFPEEYAANTAFARSRSENREAGWTNWSDDEHRALLRDRYGEGPTDQEVCRSVVLGLALARRRINLREVRNRFHLADFLAVIHDQTNLTIVADGLQRTSRTRYHNLLMFQPEYRMDEALRELAVRFQRKVRSENGSLFVSSYRYAIDKLYEEPNSTISAYVEKKRKAGALGFIDLCALARILTEEQLEGLDCAPPGEQPLRTYITCLRRCAPVFRLWNRLTDEQRNRIGGGLALADLPAGSRKDFWLAAAMGTPAVWPEAPASPTLWMDLEGTGVRIRMSTGVPARPYRVLNVSLTP